MDHSKRLRAQVYTYIASALILVGIFSIVAWYMLFEVFAVDSLLAIIICFVSVIGFSLILSEFVLKAVLEPLNTLVQAIMHVAPGHEHSASSPPNLEAIRTGKELINNMAMQVYQLASYGSSQTADTTSHRKELIQAINIVNHLPLPMFVLNTQRIITNASESAITYVDTETSKLFGQTLEDAVRLTFPSEHTLNQWMEECQKNKVTTTGFWERVRVTLPDQSEKQCDLSAQYNRDNPSGADFIITMFDRTEHYQQDDDSLNFVAMAVHELRTPVTMLRGYIEVFEDELGENLSEELQDFMHKMEVAAGQLTIFVNNILNVARIEQNQLMMQLQEADWNKALKAMLDDIQIRTDIYDITLERHIDDNIPSVGIDRVSIYEVIANLIDNAIKYRGDSKKIIVTSKVGSNGLIHTTVQDFGVGMPSSVTTNLFEKFYRNHRTRNKISGTGLGLYLTKAIISAHGGQVWVNSKEGEGSTFGFSVVPYAQLDKELQETGNKEIIRQSHGWVKNHSMYRR